MATAILLLTDDRPARAAEFEKQAERYARAVGVEPDAIHRCAEVGSLTRAAYCYRDGSVSRLAFFGHGTPSGLMRPGRWGVDTRPRRWRRPSFIAPDELAAVWAPKLADGCLVSLAACLCSRDPKWYRVQLWGRDLSPWLAKSYQDGGLKSLAAVLARSFGRRVRVRGHCAAGHCTAQALLREHRPEDEAGMGRALFAKVLDGVQPTRKLRRRWQRHVKGRLARQYLLGLCGDDALFAEITAAMAGEA